VNYIFIWLSEQWPAISEVLRCMSYHKTFSPLVVKCH